MQKLGNPEPRLSVAFTNQAKKIIRTGDILLSHENLKLTNLFVPGYWGHAAMYKHGKVIEAIGDYSYLGKKYNGVRLEDYYRWCYQKDSAVLLRPKFSHHYINSLAAHYAAEQVLKPYDYGFSPNTKAFYCSELCTYAYDEAMKDFGLASPFVLRKQFGVLTSTPQDFYDSGLFDILLEERN